MCARDVVMVVLLSEYGVYLMLCVVIGCYMCVRLLLFGVILYEYVVY